jgi:ribonuclease-3 family protein
MENRFQMNFTKAQVDAISNLGLAHVGDGVYELLVRSYLCMKGDQTVKTLHKDAISLVKAASQAKFAEVILPLLTEEEFAYYRRGKNTHTHAAPKGASPREYAMATGLETLFGALYLYGRTQRLSELFEKGMESYGI